MELERKDWEDLKKQAELNLKQAMISQMQFQKLLDLSLEKLAEFKPEEEKEAEALEEEIDKSLQEGS